MILLSVKNLMKQYIMDLNEFLDSKTVKDFYFIVSNTVTVSINYTNCCGLNVQCLPQAHVCEYLIHS